MKKLLIATLMLCSHSLIVSLGAWHIASAEFEIGKAPRQTEWWAEKEPKKPRNPVSLKILAAQKITTSYSAFDSISSLSLPTEIKEYLTFIKKWLPYSFRLSLNNYESALSAAAKENRCGLVPDLINLGANINKIDNWGDFSTPLACAVARNHEEMVRTLLAQGAEVNKMGTYHLIPFILAASLGHAAIVKIFLEHKADIEQQAFYLRETALMQAADNGHIEVVEMLLQEGADAAVTNRDGKTAADLARVNGHVAIVKLLERKK